jgi:hypothetical protein
VLFVDDPVVGVNSTTGVNSITSPADTVADQVAASHLETLGPPLLDVSSRLRAAYSVYEASLPPPTAAPTNLGDTTAPTTAPTAAPRLFVASMTGGDYPDECSWRIDDGNTFR